MFNLFFVLKIGKSGERSVVQPGRTLRSGRRGRWFESSHSDQSHKIITQTVREVLGTSGYGCLFFATKVKPAEKICRLLLMEEGLNQQGFFF